MLRKKPWQNRACCYIIFRIKSQQVTEIVASVATKTFIAKRGTLLRFLIRAFFATLVYVRFTFRSISWFLLRIATKSWSQPRKLTWLQRCFLLVNVYVRQIVSSIRTRSKIGIRTFWDYEISNSVFPYRVTNLVLFHRYLVQIPKK